MDTRERTFETSSLADAPFRMIADRLPLKVWSARVDGNPDYFNTALKKFTGITESDAAGSGWSQALHAEDLASIRESWLLAVCTGQPYETQCRLRKASDGTFRWHVMQVIRLAHSDDGQTRWLGTLTDIHEQKTAEEKQRFFATVSQELAKPFDYELTLKRLAHLAVPVMADWCTISILNKNGELQRVAVAHADPGREELRRAMEARKVPNNGAFLNALDTGQSILFTKITAEDIARYTMGDETHARLLYGLGANSGIVVPLIARGHKLGLIVMHYGHSGRAYQREDLAAAEDFAHRAAIALDNARLYQQAQETIRMRDEFLSIASHELRTPLASLFLLLERMEGLLDALGIQGDIATLLSKSEGNVHRLSHLVDKLLDLTRIRQGRLEISPAQVDLAALVKDVIARHSFAASGVTLRMDASEQVLGHWDPSRIEQIVTNLISNAVKYGGAKPVEVSVESTGDGALARLAVRDQGKGIAAGDLSRLFRIFERVNPTPGSDGLGLGLYISQQIAAAHGGRISVESRLGTGSVFTVELPLLSR